MPDRPGVTTTTEVWTAEGGAVLRGEDALATEEPLEVRVVVDGQTSPVAVTMRTPGADFELAVGFLYAEGVITGREAVRRVTYCVDPLVDDEQRYNIVNVELVPGTAIDLSPLERHFSVTSACGVCGKASLESLRLRGYERPRPGPVISPELLDELPRRLRERQSVFKSTGGLHATGLFNADGELVVLREDVGRHNAMDKVVGSSLLAGRLPLSDHLLLVSGRSSFELVQKALAAGVGFLCSVSAPSSLAVSLAREFGLTLVGFLREGRFQVYSGLERVGSAVSAGTRPGP